MRTIAPSIFVKPIFCTLISFCLVGASQADKLVFDEPQMAGISGFRTMWNQSVPLEEDGMVEYTDAKIKDRHGTAVWAASQRGELPGPIAFDGLQRSILVRFPGAAEAIAAKLKTGQSIKKVELVLPFRDVELWPQHGKDLWDPKTGGYTGRRNWGVDRMYRESQPNWHAVAWALRRPWSTDNSTLAPTYNAFIQGAGYWAHSGAKDEALDRFSTRLGPTEVSTYKPTGRMDVTAVLVDKAFGDSPGERLRVISDSGFLVKKWETYDHRYFNGVYEWATACGGRAILINTPKLEVIFERGAALNVKLPPAANVAELAEQLKASGKGGRPQARLMTEAQLMAFNKRLMDCPKSMPPWQFDRIRQLRALAGFGQQHAPQFETDMFFDIFLSNHVVKNLYGTRTRIDGASVALPAKPYERYKAWVDKILSRQPRGWSGFEAAKEMAQWYTYGEALPQPAQDAIHTYWTAWLMPDRDIAPPNKHRDPSYIEGGLIHPMADQLAGKTKGGTETYVKDTYWEQTGDWRGNKSFYRAGFTHSISTQNFNTTSSAGAMLAGSIIDAPLAIADGRHGFKAYPLGLWAWPNGSSQEHIDHYYYSITCSGNKAVYDFGPTLYDRLLGRSVVTYNVEELIGAWHPNLRRFIAPASRTTLEHLLVATDGIQHIMHSLSRKGALFDFGKPQHVPTGMKLIGHEVPPEIVALQSSRQPWAGECMANLVDEKPLPYYATHSFDGGWRRAYLGRHFGLASVDRFMPRIQIMAQWRREAATVDQNTDLGTMDVRFGFNETRFASTGGGYLGRSGSTLAMQHKNKMLVLSSPFPYWNGPNGVGIPGSGNAEEIKSLQTSVVLFNYQDPPTWKIYIDGRQVTTLPVTAKQGQAITIHDGVTYIGIVPLKATDLGRDAEVTIESGTTQMFGKAEVTSALVVNNYNLRRDQPLAHGQDDFEEIDAAYGGFAVELHDADDFHSVAAFQKYMTETDVQQSFDKSTHLHSVVYSSGEDVIEAAAPTVDKAESKGQINVEQFVRTVNKANPYPAAEIKRDTNTSQMGTGGQLGKGGATLLHRPTAPAYLFVEPKSKTFRGVIPTPTGSWFHLELPGGLRLRTDGRVNMFDATVHGDGSIEIWHTLNPRVESVGENFAHVLVIDRAKKQPFITLNGKPFIPRSNRIEGQDAWLLPLNERPTPGLQVIESRLQSIEQL